MKKVIELDFEIAAKTFYAALFRDAPEIEMLFKLGKGDRTIMMINALSTIADMSNNHTQVADFMKMLGEQHRGYGITREQMDIGAKAFREAVQAAGQHLTDEERQHFISAFRALQKSMGYEI